MSKSQGDPKAKKQVLKDLNQEFKELVGRSQTQQVIEQNSCISDLKS